VAEAIKPICIKRVLVCLDSSKHSFAALKAAIEIARQFNAVLRGIFVEDVKLLNLAEMPFQQEVGEYTAIVRELSSDGLSRGLVIQSRWVSRSFQKLIDQTDLQADFAIHRGDIIESIDKESKNCDLIIIGKTGTSPLGKPKLGSTARALIQNHNKPLLLVEERNQIGYPMILLYENSPIGQMSLETAKEMLDPQETLLVLLNNDDPVSFLEEKKVLSEWATSQKVNISIQTFKAHTFQRFIHTIDGLKTGLFFLPHSEESPYNKIINLCLNEITLPIFLMRTIFHS
jgi:nucleotide-binding universal stress UspA family protein